MARSFSIRRFVRSNARAPEPFRRLTRYVANGDALVAAFYACSIYMCAVMLVSIRGTVDSKPEWDFLWPLAWVPHVGVKPTLEILGVLTLVASVLVLVLRQMVWARAVFFVLFFMASSVVNSLGGINHYYHAWVWVAFIFCFLPGGRPERFSRNRQMGFLTVILAAQVLMFFFYSMAGFWKVYAGIEALIAGQPGNFSFGSLSWQLADRKLQTTSDPLLSDIVIYNPALATLLFYAVFYIQIVAVVAAFRPRLHMIWGGFLILFHVGTWLLMDIIFREHVALLAILFLLSPQRDLLDRPAAVIRDMPLIGWVLSPLLRPKPAPGPSVEQAG